MSGIQSLERAARILRTIGADQGSGARLMDIAAQASLNKATAHRILATLIDEGFVDKDPVTGHYFLGLGLFALGLASASRLGGGQWIRPAMLRLAEKTGDTIYFSVRDGNEAICLERVEGSFPIKTLTLKAGDRRPLGVGAGSMALLAFLSDEEIRRVIEANAPRVAGHGDLDAASLHELVDACRRLGYSLNEERIIPGMSAVGVPVRDARGTPVAALSVAAISSRMQEDRRRNIVAWLHEEATEIERRFNPTHEKQAGSRGPGRPAPATTGNP